MTDETIPVPVLVTGFRDQELTLANLDRLYERGLLTLDEVEAEIRRWLAIQHRELEAVERELARQYPPGAIATVGTPVTAEPGSLAARMVSYLDDDRGTGPDAYPPVLRNAAGRPVDVG